MFEIIKIQILIWVWAIFVSFLKKKEQIKGCAFVFLNTLKMKYKKDFPHLAFNLESGDA